MKMHSPFEVFEQLPIAISKKQPSGNYGLCDFIKKECHRHVGTALDIVTVIPNGFPPPSEAIAIITNAAISHNTSGSDYYWGIYALTQRLRDSSPWLSKIIYIVSPSSVSNATMHHTANAFLQSYYGESHRNLPAFLTFPLLRTVLIFDVNLSMTRGNKNQDVVRIYPQGHRGTLPNLDLVFGIIEIFSFSSRNVKVFLHPFYRQVTAWNGWLIKRVPKFFWQYFQDLMGMIAFMASLALAPPPPHAPFLDRGIESLSINATFLEIPTAVNNDYISPQIANLLQNIEHSIHALSNLHESLHHSVFQYLLPSSTKFVSNGEFIYSFVFVTLPMLIRAGLLLLNDISAFQFRALWAFVLAWGLVSLPLALFSNSFQSQILLSFALFYILSFIIFQNKVRSYCKDRHSDTTVQMRLSLQCIACLMSAYIHVPMAMIHYSLAMPSALFFSPILAFAPWTCKQKSLLTSGFCALFFVLTWPPLFLIPFMGLSSYLLQVYTPLHFLFACIWFL